MPRVLAVVMLLLVAGPATGVSAFFEDCTEDCGENDKGGGCCPPVCPSCVCTVRAATVVPSSEASCSPPAEVATDSSAIAASDDVPPNPDPTEILHVPRRST